MDINCSIIGDVLPLYIEELCSDDTKELVEHHLRGCEECQETHRRMTATPASELTELAQNTKENKPPQHDKPINAKRVIKKIRRRLIALLLAVLLFVPVGILTVNQFRGAGLSYTSLPRVLKTNSFMSAIVNGKYEKAFSYLDIERIFNRNATTEYTDFSDHPLSQYRQVEIDGSVYYITDSIYLNEYAHYINDDDVVLFWYSLLLRHESTHNPLFFFPEEMMAEFRLEIAADENLSDIETSLSEFHLLKGEYGSYYVGAIPSDITDLTLEYFFQYESLELYPEVYYNQVVQREKESITKYTAYANEYKELGLEAYTDLSKNAFIENLKSIEAQGYKFVGYRQSDIVFYQVDGKTQYQITYALNVTKNAVQVKGISVYIICTSDGIFTTGFMYLGDYPDRLQNSLIQTFEIMWPDSHS